MSSKVDNKGRILIPKEIRDKVNLQEGNKVVFSIAGNTILIRKTLNDEEFKKVAIDIREELAKQSNSPIDFEKVI